ncbi:MAG: flippase-like domain-containing protein [Clostridiales bacterium]|nr:flippase-like domain-containing protein [Clostridiales bacterium]
MNQRKIILSLLIGTVFSAIALYFTFKNIPFRDLLDYLKTINYWWVIPSVAVGIISFLFRVVRWQIILSPVKKTNFINAFHPLIIGFMLNSIFPARVGEVARPAIFSKKEKVAFSKVLATVGAERVFDAVTLLLFFISLNLVITTDPSTSATFGGYTLDIDKLNTILRTTFVLSLVLIAVFLVIVVPKTRGVLNDFIFDMPGLLPFGDIRTREKIREKFCVRVVDIIENLASGLEILKSLKSVTLCFLISVVVWATVGLSFYVMALGCPGISISFLEMCAVMVIICFFISLPSVPGFWGLFEAGGVFGMMLFGIPATEAAGFNLAVHFFQIVPVVIIGLFSALIIGMNLLKLLDYNIHNV